MLLLLSFFSSWLKNKIQLHVRNDNTCTKWVPTNVPSKKTKQGNEVVTRIKIKNANVKQVSHET